MRLVAIGLVFFLGSCLTLEAQNGPWSRRIEAGITASTQNRILWQVTATPRTGYTEKVLSDSFRASDKFQNSLSAFMGIVFNRQRDLAYSVTLGYQQWGFIRRKENGMFGYQPHPDLAIYAHFVDGPAQVMDYHFMQRYFTAEFKLMRRLDGVKLTLPNTELFGWISAMPAVLINDKVQIRTRGFSLEEGDKVNVSDVTMSLDALDKPVYAVVVNPLFNAFVGAGLRAEYALDESFKFLAQPRFDMALIPNFNGVQTASSYRFGVDFGIVYLLP